MVVVDNAGLNFVFCRLWPLAQLGLALVPFRLQILAPSLTELIGPSNGRFDLRQRAFIL